MISILIVCCGGISTSFLVQNMKQAMEKRRMKGTIQARAITEVPEYINQVDVVVIAPQAQFLKERVKEICTKKGKIWGLMSPTLYGTMDGDKALDFDLSLQTQKKGG